MRLVIDMAWRRKNIYCSMEKEIRMSQENKDKLLSMLDQKERAIGGRLIDVINSLILHCSVNAARKLCKYLSLSDQVKAELNTGLLSMVMKLQKQASELLSKQGYDSFELTIPTEGTNTGIVRLVNLFRYCLVGVEVISDYKPTIISYITNGLSDRKFFVEFAEQLRCRIQLFAAGGGVITPTELAREMIKGLSSCPNILEPAKNSLVLIKTNGSAVKF